MNNKEFIDVRCILFCKSFQAQNNPYSVLETSLKKEWGTSFESYYTFGEYDRVFSFLLKNSNRNLLKQIEYSNHILSTQVSDSVFFKSLYLLYPTNEKYTEETDSFWALNSPFFFVSVIHANHCCADWEIIQNGREHIISNIDKWKKNKDDKNKTKSDFRYRVYYSLDLSDYIIVWKTKEPAHVLCAIRYLYEVSNLTGYTSTVYALPSSRFESIEETKKDLGSEPFSMSIQAVAQSYNKAKDLHSKVVSSLKINHEVEPYPTFSLGNDDYLGFFKKVLPEALYDLFNILKDEEDLEKAVISLNAVMAINGYSESCNMLDDTDSSTLKEPMIFDKVIKNKKNLSDTCYQIKNEFISLFNNNAVVFDLFYWKKTLVELLILLDNMSKSTVFDSACFLFLDSAHLFLMFLKHLRNKYDDENLIYALNKKELQIETFIREWEQLINHVVQIDGAFQKTPGYEPLNYNISENIVEFHNAFAKKVITYFSALDETKDNPRVAHVSSFVVPKLCRKFKTIQWFCDNRKKDSMLFITIPISKTFETFSNMVALTHEICHYCSNDVRSRQYRKDSLLLCIAILVCSKLGLISNNTISKAYNILESSTNDREWYLSDLNEMSKTLVFRLLDKTENLSHLFKTYKADYENFNKKPLEHTDRLALKIRRESVHMLSIPKSMGGDEFEGYCSIYDLIDDLTVLFKEGYADEMMVYVLSLTPEQYLNESFSDLTQLNAKTEHNKVYYKYQRVLVVCEALVQSGIWSRESFNTCKDNENCFKEKQRSYCQEFLNVYSGFVEHTLDSKKYRTFFFNDDILRTIINYLCHCIDKIKEKEISFELSRKEIAKLFKVMTNDERNGLFSNEFQSALNYNRNDSILKWNQRTTNPFQFD